MLPRIAHDYAGLPNLDLQVGFVGTMPALSVAFLAIPIGTLANSVGQRPILLTGLQTDGLCGMIPLGLASLHWVVASTACCASTSRAGPDLARDRGSCRPAHRLSRHRAAAALMFMNAVHPFPTR